MVFRANTVESNTGKGSKKPKKYHEDVDKTIAEILECALNRHGMTYDAVEERMQSATKAFWNGIFANKMFHGRLSVKGWWTTSTQSLRLGVKTGRGPIQMMEKIKGWETKTMMRLFRFKRQKNRDVGGPSILERAIWPVRYGYRWACLPA